MRHLIGIALATLMALPALAAEIGDDGLHKAPWMRETFKDLAEDHAEAAADGKRLMVLIEQRGCIYCTEMHEEVYPRPEIAELLQDDYFVIQINMFGSVEVTDFDGTTLPEKDMVRRWGAMFTPTMMFFGEDTPDAPADEAAVATMPGAFGPATTRHLLTWVRDSGYETDEPFQKYHARKLEEEGDT